MRRYFLIAREVGASPEFSAPSSRANRPRKRLWACPASSPARRGPRAGSLEEGFHLDGGRLTVESEAVFEQDPINLLRLFRLADRKDLDLHPDALAAVTRTLRFITPKVRRDPAAAEVFLDILARGRRTYLTLSLMNEAGVLGRYLPEFGHIVAQMQFNMYHSYTVDEHTLRAVARDRRHRGRKVRRRTSAVGSGHAVDRRPRSAVPRHAAARHRQGRRRAGRRWPAPAPPARRPSGWACPPNGST